MKKQIKVVGIISSPRINGNTATLMREALKGAQKQGAEVTEIFLKEYKIKFCKGCSTCMAKGDCVISDDMSALKSKLATAHGIILASPNYANSFNAIMMQFLERIGLFEFLTSSIFGNKYVAGISTAGGGKAKKVAKALTNLTKNGIFRRSYVSGILGVNMHGKEIKQLPAALVKAHTLGKKMVIDIRQGHTYPLQNMLSRVFINLLLKPNFKKVIHKNKETAMKAVYDNLRLRAMI